MNIYFDMDNTIAGLFDVEDWLQYLEAEDTTPYEIALPLVRMSRLARILNALQRKGYGIGIISYTSMSGSDEYNERVARAKEEWLNAHCPSVKWDEIHICDYGIPKESFRVNVDDILFDDSFPNRVAWGNNAFTPDHIFDVLTTLKTME